MFNRRQLLCSAGIFRRAPRRTSSHGLSSSRFLLARVSSRLFFFSFPTLSPHFGDSSATVLLSKWSRVSNDTLFGYPFFARVKSRTATWVTYTRVRSIFPFLTMHRQLCFAILVGYLFRFRGVDFYETLQQGTYKDCRIMSRDIDMIMAFTLFYEFLC